MTTLDSGRTQEEILSSTKRLLTETKPFTLVSGYFPEITPDIYEALAQEKMPVIAPLTFVPDDHPTPSASFFYFLPSYADQARALIDYWLSQLAKEKRPTNPKLAIVHSDRTTDLMVAEAIRGQLQRNQLTAVAEVVISQVIQKPTDNQLTKLESANPDAVFFIGTAKELTSFNKLMPKKGNQPILLGLLAMLGADAINMPELTMAKMLLANPFDLNNPERPHFLAMMKKYLVDIQSPGLQRGSLCCGKFRGRRIKTHGQTFNSR